MDHHKKSHSFIGMCVMGTDGLHRSPLSSDLDGIITGAILEMMRMAAGALDLLLMAKTIPSFKFISFLAHVIIFLLQ